QRPTPRLPPAPARPGTSRALPGSGDAGHRLRDQRRGISALFLRGIARAHRGGAAARQSLPGRPTVTERSECSACTGQWPQPGQRIADLDQSIAYLHDDQFFPGWTVLVLKRHATELFALTPAERAALMEEVSNVAEALAGVFNAHKMNYELLGNQIAHIHWHLIPRLADDPRRAEPVWRHDHRPLALPAAERNERIARIRAALKR